jgi:hypothetical protein
MAEPLRIMGIYDRDYMRRQPEGDEDRAPRRGDQMDAYFSRFLARNPRFFTRAGIALAALFVIGLIALKFLGRGR